LFRFHEHVVYSLVGWRSNVGKPLRTEPPLHEKISTWLGVRSLHPLPEAGLLVVPAVFAGMHVGAVLDLNLLKRRRDEAPKLALHVVLG